MVSMMSPLLIIAVAALGHCAVISNEGSSGKTEKTNSQVVDEKESDDLKTAASQSYVRRDWGNGYGGYGVTGYGLLDDRYNSNYGGNGYDNGYGGYGNSNYGGYNKGYSGYYGGNGGYGGYGGYGGNGGLNSYYGYNNPYYQSNNHLGYGYYNKRPGYGNIYSNGITPSLVVGYRGYSR